MSLLPFYNSSTCFLPMFRPQSLTNSLLELNLERSTWQLASVLYADRLETQACGPAAEQEEMVIEEVIRSGFASPPMQLFVGVLSRSRASG